MMIEDRTCALGALVVWVVVVVGVMGCTRPADEPGVRPDEAKTDDGGGEPSAQAVTPEVGRRLALVIGNESYPVSPLFNPVNDARAVSAALTDVGFSVTRVEDATRQEMASAIATFAGSVDDDDVALFYYAGHGIEVDRENYLIPTDYRGRTAEAARLQGISAADVQEALASARVAMLVFDACRNNPYRGTRGGWGCGTGADGGPRDADSVRGRRGGGGAGRTGGGEWVVHGKIFGCAAGARSDGDGAVSTGAP